MRAVFLLLLLQPLFLGGQQSPATSPASAVLQNALQLLDHGRANDAIALLLPLAATQPRPKGIEHELGLAYYRTGKLVEARDAFAAATKEDPSDIESIQMEGLTLYRLGQPAAAIPYLERVRQWTAHSNADANYVLGLCYLNSQQYDKARGAFAAQYGVTADSAQAYLLLGTMLMHANMPELAGQAASKAIQLAPGLPLAHLMLGEVDLFKSNVNGAVSEFEREREIDPGNSTVYDRLGDAYTRLGRYEEAQQSLMKAISLDTSYTGPFLQMGKVLLRRNDPQTALMYLKHAEKMDPGNYMVHTLLSQAYRATGQQDDARREMDIVSKIHSSSELKLQPVQ